MTDASKRRMVEHEIQDDDWSSVDPLESMPVLTTDPAIEDDLKKMYGPPYTLTLMIQWLFRKT